MQRHLGDGILHRVATATAFSRRLIDDSPRKAVKVREVIKLIEEDGWYLVATRGSHRQFKHHHKAGRVTIAGHPGHVLAPGTLNSILKQTQVQRPGEAEGR